MRYASLADFIKTARPQTLAGPVGLIFIEDLTEVESTVAHHLAKGFHTLLLLAPPAVDLPAATEGKIHRIDFDATRPGAVEEAVNAVIDAVAPGTWIYYGFNGEYLFYPFCENRSVGEMLAFHAEERRDAMLAFVVDLYPGDLEAAPDGVSLGDAWLDRSGYYALARRDPAQNNHPKERQLDFFGGLRWRFEEHVPHNRRRIDRVALFRAKKGLVLRPDRTFSDEEYNTFSCPWHHNLTGAVASFRAAKALRANAGSRHTVVSFRWHNSVKFDWSSQQLMDLGLMEPGQWF